MPGIKRPKVTKGRVCEEDDLDICEADDFKTDADFSRINLTGAETSTFTRVMPNQVSEDTHRGSAVIRPPAPLRPAGASIQGPDLEPKPLFNSNPMMTQNGNTAFDDGLHESHPETVVHRFDDLPDVPTEATEENHQEFCLACGNLLMSDSEFCRKCGQRRGEPLNQETTRASRVEPHARKQSRLQSRMIPSDTGWSGKKKGRRSSANPMVNRMMPRLTMNKTLCMEGGRASQGATMLTPFQALELLADINQEFKDEGDVVFSNNIQIEYHEFMNQGDQSSHHYEASTPTKLEALLQQRFQAPSEQDKHMERCRWIHIPGVNPQVLNVLEGFFGLDPSSITKTEHRNAQPCVEGFGHYLFIVAHELQRNPNEASCSAFIQQQVTMFHLPRWNSLITIQEDDVDPWSDVRVQLENESSLLRKTCDPTLLIYMLLDALIDGVHPILEDYGEYLSGLDRLITRQAPQHDHVALSYEIKRHVWEIRRFAWRTRNMIDDLQQDPWDMVPVRTKRLLCSIRRSANSIAEVAAAYLESAQAIETYYESYQTNEMNNTLYTLSMLTMIIIPSQFLTGVFGMNFEAMPELKWKYSYLIFWCFCISFAIGTFIILWRRGILRRRVKIFTSNEESDWST